MDLREKQPLSLHTEYIDVLNQLESSDEHFFITGKAGTGKSTLLQLFRSTTKKKFAVLAPTGIAALNVRGQTIHSFFGFPPRMLDRSEIVRRKDFRFFNQFDGIIIDEVSMVRADVLDNIDLFLRIQRNNNQPFGGVQMVFFGDLFQLPPVISSDFERKFFRETYESPYFFSARVFTGDCGLNMIELHQVFRQDEKHFIRLLDNIRQRSFDYDDLMELNERVGSPPDDIQYLINLCARNATADQINKESLAEIDDPPAIFYAKVEGDFAPSFFPTESQLLLKRGAQVMFVKNDLQKQFVNGTLGILKHIEEEELLVDILDEHGRDKTIKVARLSWENIKYRPDHTDPSKINAEVTGSFTQFPLRLAWAITIHKSQGKTFDRVNIDMGQGAFEAGQTYVALSRCRKLGGIYLKKAIEPRDIIVDPLILEYYERMKRWG
ncbi:MAG TPA: DEAD/DEAH box helicase [Saprospiraceae bacterium]|nr:DEAD/DEAH box helicase [Saprospiraceae bacterium]